MWLLQKGFVFKRRGKEKKTELCVQKVTRLRASPGPCYVGALTES